MNATICSPATCAVIVLVLASGCARTPSLREWRSSDHNTASGTATPANAVVEQDETPIGVSLFRAHCVSCHGEDGAGGTSAPPMARVQNLRDSTLDRTQLLGVIRNGRGAFMPAFGQIPAAGLESLVETVIGLRTPTGAH